MKTRLEISFKNQRWAERGIQLTFCIVQVPHYMIHVSRLPLKQPLKCKKVTKNTFFIKNAPDVHVGNLMNN